MAQLHCVGRAFRAPVLVSRTMELYRPNLAQPTHVQRPRRLVRRRYGMPSVRRLQWPLLRALAAAVSLGTSTTRATPTPPPRPASLRLTVRNQGVLRECWLKAHAGSPAGEAGSDRRRRGEKRATTEAFLSAPGVTTDDSVRYHPRRVLSPTVHRTLSTALQRNPAFTRAWSSVARAFRVGDSAMFGRKAPRRRSRQERQRLEPGSAERSGLLYMREGIFQALPFPVRITVMGGGNFGLALSLVLARNQIPTTLLVRTETVAEHINTHHEHPKYLRGIRIPQHVHATSDPREALKDATYVIHAVPVQYTRKFLEKVAPHMPPGAPIMSVSKGIETSSLMLMNDILKEACGKGRSYAFLSGPSFAREIAMNQATAVVIASDDTCLANDFAKVLSSPSFRCFTSKDVIGVEVGGAVKNVIALAAGMCEGLGLGTNAMAGLVTRGCGEMRRMAVILGGQPRTLSGLSGVGDTFGTCFGPLSRNRNFGIRLGKGESMAEILASSTEVAEGVDTALALADLIKKIDKSYRIDLKYAIIFGVADILRGKRSPKEGLEDLMTMPLRAEMYDS